MHGHFRIENVIAESGNARVRHISRDSYIYDAGRAYFVDQPLLTSYHYHLTPLVYLYTKNMVCLLFLFLFVSMNMHLIWHPLVWKGSVDRDMPS